MPCTFTSKDDVRLFVLTITQQTFDQGATFDTHYIKDLQLTPAAYRVFIRGLKGLFKANGCNVKKSAAALAANKTVGALGDAIAKDLGLN
jgi:hypothetical protein